MFAFEGTLAPRAAHRLLTVLVEVVVGYDVHIFHLAALIRPVRCARAVPSAAVRSTRTELGRASWWY
jgi:hypothetical protein